MKITQTMKYPGSREYEMHYVTVEIDSSEIPDKMVDDFAYPQRQKWNILQFICQREVLSFAVTRGLIPAEQILVQLERVRNLLPDEIQERIKKYGL